MNNSDQQEKFWSGEFGNEYTDRNHSAVIVASNTHFFSRILRAIPSPPKTILELGANCGLNLVALNRLLPTADLTGVELNEKAYTKLKTTENVKAIHGTLYSEPAYGQFDLVFTKGVLIHLNPDRLAEAYERLYRLSSSYILIAEYYSPTPQEIAYRGNDGVLFKRDFAGEILEKYRELRLVDYGFTYRRDKLSPQDDINWFLLKKV